MTGGGRVPVRHQLIRDAAYAGIPNETRAELHERFADWLDGSAPDRPGLEEIVASHLDPSYAFRAELGPLDEATRAIGVRVAELLSDPGDRAADRGDAPAAAAMWKRAFELLPDGDPEGPALAAAAAWARFDPGSVELVADAVGRAERAGSAEADAGLATIGAFHAAAHAPATNPQTRIIELAAEVRTRNETGEGAPLITTFSRCSDRQGHGSPTPAGGHSGQSPPPRALGVGVKRGSDPARRRREERWPR